MQRSYEIYEYRTYGPRTETLPRVLSNAFSNLDPQVIFNNMFMCDEKDDVRTYPQQYPLHSPPKQPEFVQRKVEAIKTKEFENPFYPKKVDTRQNRELVKERNIDKEAEEFIKRKRKNFEKWDTSKPW